MKASGAKRLLALLDAPELDGGVLAEIQSFGDDGLTFLVATAVGRRSERHVRARAIDALGVLRAPLAAPALVRLLRDPALGAHAAYALALIDPAGAVKDLLPLVNGKNVDRMVRAHALEALGEISDDRAAEQLEQWAARETDPAFRTIAVRVLARLRRRGLLAQKSGSASPQSPRPLPSRSRSHRRRNP